MEFEFRGLKIKIGDKLRVTVWRAKDSDSKVTHEGVAVFDECCLCIEHKGNNCAMITPLRSYAFYCDIEVLEVVNDEK